MLDCGAGIQDEAESLIPKAMVQDILHNTPMPLNTLSGMGVGLCCNDSRADSTPSRLSKRPWSSQELTHGLNLRVTMIQATSFGVQNQQSAMQAVP